MAGDSRRRGIFSVLLPSTKPELQISMLIIYRVSSQEQRQKKKMHTYTYGKLCMWLCVKESVWHEVLFFKSVLLSIIQ